MKFPQFVRPSLLAGASFVLTATGMTGSAVASSPSVIPSALVIAKSSNKNEVHYAVQVDDSCAPAGPHPVSPYWRMLERGPDVVEPLSRSEQGALGLERQERTSEGLELAVHALPGRVLTLRTWRAPDGHCASSVATFVNGVVATLGTVYVKQRLFGISYVLLTGVTADGSVVQERVHP